MKKRSYGKFLVKHAGTFDELFGAFWQKIELEKMCSTLKRALAKRDRETASLRELTANLQRENEELRQKLAEIETHFDSYLGLT